MTTREALLADILVHPEDDLRRLVYADWLEENREPERAEFIRTGVELAKVKSNPKRNKRLDDGMFAIGYFMAYHREKAVIDAVLGDKTPCRCEQCLGERLCELVGEYGPPSDRVAGVHLMACLDPDRGMVSAGIPGTAFGIIRCGFISEIRCTLADWMRIGPAVVRSHPVTRVDVTDVSFSGGVWAWDAGPLGIGAAATEDIARKRISIAALAWAKSQPVTQPDISGCVGTT